MTRARVPFVLLWGRRGSPVGYDGPYQGREYPCALNTGLDGGTHVGSAVPASSVDDETVIHRDCWLVE